MMGKSYQRKTNRSRRKMQKLDGQAVTVELADGKAAFQMILPMSEMLFDVAKAIEQTASQAGLLMMKALIDEEVEQLAGSTNIIESCFSFADDLCRNVKRWRDANMAWRWAGTVLLEVEKRFHRIKGYRDLPLLIKALQKLVDHQEEIVSNAEAICGTWVLQQVSSLKELERLYSGTIMPALSTPQVRGFSLRVPWKAIDDNFSLLEAGLRLARKHDVA